MGGTVGVELNVPRKVFEYWQSDELPEFTASPARFRRNDKMPPFGQLGREAIAEILHYVEHMKQRKAGQSTHEGMTPRRPMQTRKP